jgi:hypothetical protein
MLDSIFKKSDTAKIKSSSARISPNIVFSSRIDWSSQAYLKGILFGCPVAGMERAFAPGKNRCSDICLVLCGPLPAFDLSNLEIDQRG